MPDVAAEPPGDRDRAPDRTTVRARWADRAAIGQGLRTAVVAFGGFALGYWGMHRLQVAVFATFGGLALSGIADFGGRLRGRAPANAAATAAGVGLAALGTWASTQVVAAATAVTFAVGIGIVVSGLLGGYFAAAPNAVILYYLVAIGSPAPAAAVPDRIYGVLIGGALATVASVVLWPERPVSDIRLALAGWAGALADALSDDALSDDALSDDAPYHDGCPPGVSRPPGAIRAAVDAGSDRPAGPTLRDRATLYLLNDLERLDRLAARTAGATGLPFDRESRAAAGMALQRVAATLRRGPGAPDPADPELLDQPPDHDARGGHTRPEQPFGLAARLRAAAGSAERHAALAVGAAPPRSGYGSRLSSPVLHAQRRLRANLSPRSVHLQDGLRTGTALALAYLLARHFALQHGFWVELATLTVVRSGAAATTRFVGRAVAGTALGVALAFAVIGTAGSHAAAYAVITPVAIAMAIYLRSAFGFVAGQAGFTVSVLVLFSLLSPGGWHIAIVRMEDVLVGAAAGLAASVVAWPRGAMAALGPAAADLVQASTRYLRRTVDIVVGGPVPGTDPGPETGSGPEQARQAAMAAVVRAESAFAQMIAERSDQEMTAGWAAVMAAANRLWYAGDLIAATPGEAVPVDRDEVDRALTRLDEVAGRAGRSLRSTRMAAPVLGRPGPPPVPAARPVPMTLWPSGSGIWPANWSPESRPRRHWRRPRRPADGTGASAHQGCGRPSRKKPPRGPSSGRVAAQTTPATLAETGRAPMDSAPGHVAVRSGSTALMMTGVPSNSAAKVDVRASSAALETP